MLDVSLSPSRVTTAVSAFKVEKSAMSERNLGVQVGTGTECILRVSHGDPDSDERVRDEDTPVLVPTFAPPQ